MNNKKYFALPTTLLYLKSLAISLALLIISSCGNLLNSSNNNIMSEIPGSSPLKPLLGQAYDSRTAKILNISCLTGTKIEVGNSIGELKYTQDASYKNIVDNLNGSLSVGVQFPAVSASAGIKYASENATSNLSETHTIYLNATPKSIKFLPDSFELSKSGKYYVENKSDQLYQKCGDEFITQIDLGASLIATLKFEFANTKDKEEFKGKLRVNVNAGIGSVNVDGDLNKLTEKIRTRTSVTINAMQLGGKTTQLFTIMPATLVICNLNDITPCLETFRNIIQYGKTDFVNQLQDKNSFNIIKYITAPYADSGYIAEQLLPKNPPEAVSDSVLERRATWQEEFEKELSNNHRATKILEQMGDILSSEQLKNIEKIKDYSKINYDNYAEGVQFCFDNPDNKCLEKVIEKKQYDLEDLEIEEVQTTPMFYKHCLERTNPEASKTVDAIILAATLTGSCKDMELQLSGLTELKIFDNQISNLEPLQGLTNLSTLFCSCDQISNLKPLQSLVNLTSLMLINSKISNIKPLQSLSKLSDLTLSYNQISNIEPIQNLTNLKILSISGNQISDLRPLQYLTGLTEIGINNNKISNLEPLRNLTSLTHLGLDYNQITSLEPLQGLLNLDQFGVYDLLGNRIIKDEANCPTKPGISNAVKSFCEAHRK